MAVQLWETLKEAIVTYTGLSPATFFTILAVAFAFYYAVSGIFSSFSAPAKPPTRTRSVEEMAPLPPPVQLGEITEEELKSYDGSDPKKPLLMAIKAQIYDVSQSRMFYGPGGPYALFAGKDASRALAKMSFEEKDLNGNLEGLSVFEMDALQDWEYKFMSKYVKVGTIKNEVPTTTEPAETSTNDTAQTTENVITSSADAEPVEKPTRDVDPVLEGPQKAAEPSETTVKDAAPAAGSQ